MGILNQPRGSENSPVGDVSIGDASNGDGQNPANSQADMNSETSSKWKWFAATLISAICLAPTFISYRPYTFDTFDDAEYFQRAIAVSRAFWSGDGHGMLAGMVSIRPPAMTLLGIPWGPSMTWDEASRSFVTLAILISLLVALCLYLMMRIGVKPAWLTVASLCILFTVGPFPHPQAEVHLHATGFLADSLFSWTIMAVLLLIPYEARVRCTSTGNAVLRGMLWGLLFSLGMMTKFSFAYFVVLIIPILFFIRFREDGMRRTVTIFIAAACCAAPSVFYLLRWGRTAYEAAKDYSFGTDAGFYRIPLISFLHYEVGLSPGIGLSFIVIAAALLYLLIKKRLMQSWPDLVALLIVTGFCIVVLVSPNRHIRYEIPAFLAGPLLVAILLSGKGHSVPRLYSSGVAGLVLCGLVVASVPTVHRPDKSCLNECEAVLTQALRCKSKKVVLATDSPTLNADLMDVTQKFMAQDVTVEKLHYQVMLHVPIEKDFQIISEADQVALQDSEKLAPAFTNQRVPAYRKYMSQSNFVPARVGDDITIYSAHCAP